MRMLSGWRRGINASGQDVVDKASVVRCGAVGGILVSICHPLVIFQGFDALEGEVVLGECAGLWFNRASAEKLGWTRLHAGQQRFYNLHHPSLASERIEGQRFTA